MKLEIFLACCVPIVIGSIVLILALKERRDNKKRKIK